MNKGTTGIKQSKASVSPPHTPRTTEKLERASELMSSHHLQGCCRTVHPIIAHSMRTSTLLITPGHQVIHIKVSTGVKVKPSVWHFWCTGSLRVQGHEPTHPPWESTYNAFCRQTLEAPSWVRDFIHLPPGARLPPVQRPVPRPP